MTKRVKRSTFVASNAAVFLVLLQGCSEDPVGDLLERAGRSYLEYVLVNNVEEFLHGTCAPDHWCDPYANSVAKECLAQHMDFDSLINGPRDQRDEAMDLLLDEVTVCALVKAHELHAKSKEGDT